MARPQLGDSTGERGKPDKQPFALQGAAGFRPALFPEVVRVRKKRQIQQNDNYCEGEDVTDQGGKNRQVHINGVVGRRGKDELHDLMDSGESHTMVSATWSGEVMLKEAEIEGPVGWYPPGNTQLWEYTLDLVSTGTDENEGVARNGIISSGDLPELTVFDQGVQ